MMTLSLVRGVSADWTIQGRTRLVGDVPTGYLDSDVLTASLWTGDDQAPLFSPTVVWVDSATCQVKVSVVDTDTASLDPGDYRVLVIATRSGRSMPIAEFALTITAAPGTATPDPVYCTAEDLRRQCGWIDQVADLSQDQTGFAEQRAAARTWFDALVIDNYPNTGYSQRYPGLLTWGISGLMANSYVTDLLAANALLLTTARGKKAVRANAYYAIAQILRTKVEPGHRLAAYAAEYERRAQNAVKTLVAELDTNADGKADMVVPLCNAYTRMG